MASEVAFEAVEEGSCYVKAALRKGVCIVPITIAPFCN